MPTHSGKWKSLSSRCLQNVELTFNANKVKMSEEKSFGIQSAYDQFTLTGNYGSKHINECYTLNLNGTFQKMGDGVLLNPMRFGLKIEPRTDGPYYNPTTTAKEFIDFTVLGDGEATGITSYDNDGSAGSPTNENGKSLYDLQGCKVSNLRSGQIYIMNGKKFIAK